MNLISLAYRPIFFKNLFIGVNRAFQQPTQDNPSNKLINYYIWISNTLLKKYSSLYKTDYEFTWAYCKYFWECHVKFPELTVEQLENIVAR